MWTKNSVILLFIFYSFTLNAQNSISADLGIGLNTLSSKIAEFGGIIEESNSGRIHNFSTITFNYNSKKYTYRIGLRLIRNRFNQELYNLVGINDIDPEEGVIRTFDRFNKISIYSVGIPFSIRYNLAQNRNTFYFSSSIIFENHLLHKKNETTTFSDGETIIINSSKKNLQTFSITPLIGVGYKKQVSKLFAMNIETFVGSNIFNFGKSNLFFLDQKTITYGVTIGTEFYLEKNK